MKCASVFCGAAPLPYAQWCFAHHPAIRWIESHWLPDMPQGEPSRQVGAVRVDPDQEAAA